MAIEYQYNIAPPSGAAGFQIICRLSPVGGVVKNNNKEVLYFQLLIPPKRFDIFSPRLGDAQKV